MPLAAGLWQLGGWPRWSDDPAQLRDLGLLAVGSEAAVTTALTQLAVLLPVGGRAYRSGLLAALALAACSYALYRLMRHALQSVRPGRVNGPVALLAAWIWALGPVVHERALRPGGCALALLLLLIGIVLCDPTRVRNDARRLPTLGLLTGLALAESRWAGGLLACFVALRLVQHRWSPPRRNLLITGTATLLALGSAELLLVVRSFSPSAWLEFGAPGPGAITWRGEHALEGLPAGEILLPPWVREAGFGLLTLALAGVVACAWNRRARSAALGPLGLGLICIGARAAALAGGLAEPPVLAGAFTAALSGLAALGLQAIADGLWQASLPFCRPACALSMAAAATLALGRLEALGPVSLTHHVGARAWTEEALARLPQGSVVLVRGEALTYRLMAAQRIEGRRPDVVLLPASLLAGGSIATRLLDVAPESSALLRQLAVHGHADEYALSRLADARPLFVELDPAWDLRLLEHLRPEAMWLALSPHAIGASDRRSGVRRSLAALRRAWAAARTGGAGDETRRVLFGQAGQQALALAALGDRKRASSLLAVLRRLGPTQPLTAELSERLAARSRGPVVVADLID